ncbi:MAG: hypothetical protein V4619_13010, partial [Bacteroidota bacterium]
DHNDWEYLNLNIFDADSLDKYAKRQTSDGILKNSFIKLIRVQLNKVNGKPDTIHIKDYHK